MPLKFEVMTTPGWVRIIDIDGIQIHFSPGEALAFFHWLEEHQDEITQAAQSENSSGGGGASLPISAQPEDVPEVALKEQTSGEGDRLDMM